MSETPGVPRHIDVFPASSAACAAARLRVRLGLEEEKRARVLCVTEWLPGNEAAIERAYQLSTQLGAELSLLHVVQSRPGARRRAEELSGARGREEELSGARWWEEQLPERRGPELPGARGWEEKLPRARGCDEELSEARGREAELRRTLARVMCRHPLPAGQEVPALLVRSGNAARVLVEVTDRLGAGLVVLGSHRQRGLRGVLAESVAQRVLRACGCPVLIARREPKGPYRNILLAADASEASARAIRAAESWVLNAGASATIMVSHEPTYEQMLSRAKTRSGSRGTRSIAWRVEARAMLETLLQRVSVDEGRYALRVEQDPRPAVAIRRLAEQTRPDLLVMGTRGRARWRRVLFGSVTSQVLRTVNCDVMVVPDGPSGSSFQCRS